MLGRVGSSLTKRCASVIVTNKSNGVSVVELNNPPVNLLTKECIQELVHTFNELPSRYYCTR